MPPGPPRGVKVQSHTGTPKSLQGNQGKAAGGGRGRVTVVANYETINLAKTITISELGWKGIYTPQTADVGCWIFLAAKDGHIRNS